MGFEAAAVRGAVWRGLRRAVVHRGGLGARVTDGPEKVHARFGDCIFRRWQVFLVRTRYRQSRV